MVAAAILIAASHADHDPVQAAPAPPDLSSAVMAAATTVVPAATPTSDAVTFARIDDADLVLPADEVVGHGFHEPGGSGPEPLTPVGVLTGDGVAGFDEVTAVVDPAGPDYFVLPTRNRGTAPTAAVDIALEEGEDVLAPVDGVVTTVADYTLYGRHRDTLVQIRPDAAPHLEVKLLHVGGVAVAEGDTVVAGETVIADTARRFPVRNQIDRFVGRDLPHVHLEVLATTSD